MTLPATRTSSASTLAPAPTATSPKSSRYDDDPPTIWLLAQYQATGDETIRNLLIERYMPLVQSVARKLRARLTPNVDVDDLVSSGVLGLMDAISGFDETRGVKFETYCTIRINGAMLDELRERDWVPRLVRRRASRIAMARRNLAAELHRDATDEEVARHLELPMSRFQEMLREVSQPTTIVSLDVVRFEDSDSRATSRLDLVADERVTDPSDNAALADIMGAVLRFLDRREQVIMLLYYRRGFTMKRIGTVFGMSESGVCQIHTRIMKRLRRRVSAGHLGV
jgi:RNA polymerase sigma factor for flagellar operon FliA